MVMANYLTDTTVLIEYLRGDKTAAKFLVEELPKTSEVSLAELIVGTASKKDMVKMEHTISALEFVPFTSTIGSSALELLKDFYHSHGLRYLDALIAATAIEEQLVLVTDNVKHFSFIKDLQIESWKGIRKGIILSTS